MQRTHPQTNQNRGGRGGRGNSRGGSTNSGQRNNDSGRTNVSSSSSPAGNMTSNGGAGGHPPNGSGLGQSNCSNNLNNNSNNNLNSNQSSYRGSRGAGFNQRGNNRGRGGGNSRGGGKQAFNIKMTPKQELKTKGLACGIVSFGYWQDDPTLSDRPTFYNFSKLMFDKQNSENKSTKTREYFLKYYDGFLKLFIKYDGKNFEMKFKLDAIRNGIRLYKEDKNVYLLELEPKTIPLIVEHIYLEHFGTTNRARICAESHKVFENIGQTQVFLLRLERNYRLMELLPILLQSVDRKIDEIPIKKITYTKPYIIPSSLAVKISELDFHSVQYYLLVLESHGMFHPCNYTDKCLELLKGDSSTEYKNKMATVLEKVYYESLTKYPGRVFNVEETLSKHLNSIEFKFDMDRSIILKSNNQKELSLSRKVIITPTKIYYLPPELERTNRVIRYFWENKDNFYRVNFLDDNFNNLFASDFRNISHRLRQLMSKGINVSPSLYLDFLGFSSSQLRNSSSWFFLRNRLTNSKPSPQDIRDYMGDFSDIKTAAKCAARFGQCLTTTTPSIELEGEIIPIEDEPRNGFVFTDGIGKISNEMMCKIQSTLNLKEITLPSAIQFRCGGGKGMLAIDRTLKGEQIVFRTSQFKFTSIQKQLEIVDYAKRKSGFLNRQFITILSALGIKDEIFISKQKEMIDSILSITEDESKAYEWLAIYHSSSTKSFMCHVLKNIPTLVKTEVLIMNMLKSYKEQLVKELREKTKIFNPKSANLMGVVDEYNILEEDEIFIKLSSPMPHMSDDGIIRGKCIVSKNPALHIGDIRVVRAIDRPKLYHLHDVVVFSQKGDRPITNMITGSDLDGDSFFVSWDTDLIPESDYPPMDYPPPKKDDGKEDKVIIKVSDTIDFFIEFITRNNLGLIANTHLANTDFRKLGILSPECITLCGLHSIAVDSAKSGDFATIPKGVNVPANPHFMVTSAKKKYKSKKLLGKLFDNVCEVKIDPNDKMYRRQSNPLLIVDGFDKYLKETEPHYQNYSRFVHSDMIKYGIEDESQIITGWISSTIKCFGHKEHDVKETIATTISFYIKYFTNVFEEMVKKHGEAERFRIASAWYYIMYTDKNRFNIFSFGWINFRELVCIASKQKEVRVVEMVELQDLEEDSDFEDDNYNDELYDLDEDETGED